MLLQQQRLQTHLNPLGFVSALRHVGALTTLVVHWRDHAVLRLGNVNFCDHPEGFRRERQGAAHHLAVLVIQRFRGRQGRVGTVNPDMYTLPIHRVPRLRPFGLAPHEVGQARAIHKLVHHPRRDQWGIAACA